MKYLSILLFTGSILIVHSSCAPKAKASESEVEQTETAEQPDKMLRHVVMFKFKEDAPAEGINAVEAAFNALPSKISQIADYEWGTNNSPEGLDKGFTHIFFVSFKTEEDRAVYLPHPDHLAFVDVLKPVLDDVMVLDYWTKE